DVIRKHGDRWLVGQLQVRPRPSPILHGSHAIDSRGLHNIPQLLLAEIINSVRGLATDLTVDRLGEIDAARIGERLQPGRHVDAVAIGIAALDHNIAKVDADAQDDGAALWQIAVHRGHSSLQFDRALHSVVRTAKLNEHTVAGRLEDATVMTGNEGLQYFL